MDKIDESIFRSLMENPKKSFLQIAEELKLSPFTVQRRYERMKKNVVFYGITSIFNLSIIGFTGKAFLLIEVRKNSKIAVILESLKQINQLFLIVETVGNFDLIAMSVFRDISEIMGTVEEMRSIPEISRIHVALTDDCSYPLKPEYTQIDPFRQQKIG